MRNLKRSLFNCDKFLKGVVVGIVMETNGPFEGAIENGDRFGAATAVGDFNSDGYDDLAIGIPFEDISTISDNGAIAIIYGSVPGLASSASTSSTSRADQFWHQNSNNIDDSNELGDNFGSAITSG